MFFAGIYFMTGRNYSDLWEKVTVEISFYPADCADCAGNLPHRFHRFSLIILKNDHDRNVFFAGFYFMTGRNYADLWEKITVEICFYPADCADSAGNLPHRFHRFSQINFE